MTKEFVQKFAALITGAFSFMAALAWNDTIKTFITRYLSPGAGLKSMVIYAIIVTVIAVIISYYITKFSDQLLKEEKKLEKKITDLEDELRKHTNGKK